MKLNPLNNHLMKLLLVLSLLALNVSQVSAGTIQITSLSASTLARSGRLRIFGTGFSQALGQQVPASRYRPSTRSMPLDLPKVEYDEREIVRRVPATKAYISFKGRSWIVPRAFCGEPLAIRPLSEAGQFGIYFAAHQITTIDLTKPEGVSHVSEQASTMSPG